MPPGRDPKVLGNTGVGLTLLDPGDLCGSQTRLRSDRFLCEIPPDPFSPHVGAQESQGTRRSRIHHIEGCRSHPLFSRTKKVRK